MMLLRGMAAMSGMSVRLTYAKALIFLALSSEDNVVVLKTLSFVNHHDCDSDNQYFLSSEEIPTGLTGQVRQWA